MSSDLDVLKYYSDLLIIQYSGKAKAEAMVKLLANQSLCDGLPDELRHAFDLDTAVGNQLDILARIVGIERNVYGLDLQHTFFSFTRYVGTPASVGFGRYTDDPYSLDIWTRYKNFAVYTLTDFELRTVIKLKIIYNNIWSSLKDLKEALYLYFHGDIDIKMNYGTDDWFNFTRYQGRYSSYGFQTYTYDEYNGTIHFATYPDYANVVFFLTYTVKTVYTNAWLATLFLDIVPKPMGVEMETIYV